MTLFHLPSVTLRKKKKRATVATSLAGLTHLRTHLFQRCDVANQAVGDRVETF